MADEYRLTLGVEVVRVDDGAILSPDETNPDWRRYQAWLTGGGTPDPVDLSDLKSAKKMEIEAAFAAAVAAGMPYGGKVLQIDDASRQNIAAVATRAIGVVQSIAGMTWPAGFAWRMADNSYLTISAATFLAMGQAAADRYTALILHRGVLKDAVAAAADAAAIDVIDPTAGWS